jgi:hypothetical protein
MRDARRARLRKLFAPETLWSQGALHELNPFTGGASGRGVEWNTPSVKDYSLEPF